MQKILIGILCLCWLPGTAQELYVYSEPASGMPARSLGVKLGGNFIGRKDNAENRFMQRYTPELMLGVNKNLMWHVGGTFADMHTGNFRWESVYTYVKYRFLSVDDVHKHFRMAAFAEGAYSRSPFHFDELSFQGDKSGLQAGVIATQLWNKFALSGSVSGLQLFATLESHHGDEPIYNAVNYSLSGGYLLFPLNYTDYRQTNMNLYVELLGQQTFDRKTHYWDMAPAIQFIFNSTSKLNIGFRFQLKGNMERMTKESFLLAYEYTFLNALKKRKR